MPDQATTADLIELAITAERAAEALYRGLEAMFAHSTEVAGFWNRYAAEEAGHARWLEGLRDGLSAEVLATPADPGILAKARDLVRFSVERALAKVEHLEDAYQLVSDLENSETNVVFEFLIVNFGADRETQEFLRSQLRDHIGKLMTEFPLRFQQAVVRREVRAAKVRSEPR